MLGTGNNWRNIIIILYSILLYVQRVYASWVSTTSLIKPACPSIVSNGPAPSSVLSARHQAIATGYGIKKTLSPTIIVGNSGSTVGVGPLFAKRNKKGIVTKGGKLQVKLLKYVEGTGKVGDVVMVSPAFFENKLKREKSAVIVSDEEISKQKEEMETKAKEKLQIAKDLQEKLNDFLLVMPHKAGPEGHLYGGIGKKSILDEIKKKFPKGAIGGKQNKIMSIAQRLDGNDEKELKHDIKELGEYSIKMTLHPDVSAKFIVSVVSE